MSEIAEIRQVLQDLIAPDLKALKSELLAQKVSTDQQLSTLRATLDERFANAEALAQARHATVIAKFDAIEKSLDLDKRVQRIEERDAAARHVA